MWIQDNTYYYPWQQPYQYYTYPRVGWQCPGCNSCYNPDVQKCWNCGSVNILGTTSTVITNTATSDSTVQMNDKEDDGS